ncbi:hypothetical protein SLS56_004665 [Neofusicoccum ribis]|uniref:Uncharacterized protein n=1 Tax=Neofusicoccum ribis TaxID=45134 RepID=A0ABR3SVP3_9PEZI
MIWKDNQPTGPQYTFDRQAELKERVCASIAARSSTTAWNSASSPTGVESRKDDSEDKSLGAGYDGTHETRQPLTRNDVDQLITEEKNKALSVEMHESSLEPGEILEASEGPFTFAREPGPTDPTQPIPVRVSRNGDKSHDSTKSPITNVGIIQTSSSKSSVRLSRQTASPEGPDMASVSQSRAALDKQKLLARDDSFVLTQESLSHNEDHKYIPEWLDATGFYDLRYRKKKLALYRAKSTTDLVAEAPPPSRLLPTKGANLNSPHEFQTSTDQNKPSTKRGISSSACRQNINEHDRKTSKTNGTSGRPHLKG